MDKYEQVGVAGEGAYGIVLKCKRRDSGEIVAIKQFKENDEEEEEASRVIHREIQILKMLSHENIVDLREVFREKGLLHIVSGYVDSGLLDIIEAHPDGVDVEMARRLIHQLTLAIEYCHRNNVIHRDIKPDNVLVSSLNASVKLCDFGSACTLSGQQVLTDYAATRWYRAPELLVRFNDYGCGVDMWGLGCVLAELINGQPLFAGKSDIDQLFIIDNAVGPLTPQQMKRCFDLTGFVKFPENRERRSVATQLGHKATSQQIQFLSRIFVVDPKQRLTARTALSLPWLTDWSASSPPAVSSQAQISGGYCNQSRITSGDPNFGIQPKPRISKIVGVPGVAHTKEKTTVGILTGAQEILNRACQDVALESVSSFREGSTAIAQASYTQPQDTYDIVEEISDDSVTEELVDDNNSLGSPSLKNTIAINESPEPASDNQVGITAKTPQHAKSLLGSKSGMQMSSVTESPESIVQSVSMCQDSRRQVDQSIQESIDHIDESIVEDLSDENTETDHIDEKPLAKAALQHRPSPVASRGSSNRSSQFRQHIRPVSGNSARSSTLIPLS